MQCRQRNSERHRVCGMSESEQRVRIALCIWDRAGEGQRDGSIGRASDCVGLALLLLVRTETRPANAVQRVREINSGGGGTID